MLLVAPVKHFFNDHTCFLTLDFKKAVVSS